MCPVTVLADRWPAVELSWETYRRVARAFHRAKWVYLQGWGEPLLHPRILDMVGLAKDAGCQVGFTTNGTPLTLKAGERLLDLRLDLLAVSIAGASPETHEAIRVGSSFQRVIENVRRFLVLRAERRSEKPKVELLFLMTRTNLSGLPGAVELAKAVGVDELVATNLDYVITPPLDELRAFAGAAPAPAFREVMEEARARARRIGLAFRPYPLEPRPMAVCELNPLRILFVAADGWVSPCVYTGLTGQSEIPRVVESRPVRIPVVRFGNVQEQELLAIWEDAAYREFRRPFRERVLGLSRLAFVAAGGRGAMAEEEPPAPAPCRTCPKLKGL
jgi:MoaA/NifB/PqqE/SkfB family radical SAM enzyme